jgi:hypothetical protein
MVNNFGHDATIFKLSDVVISCFDCQSRYQWKVIVMDRHHGSSISCFCCVASGTLLKKQVFIGQTLGVTFVGWKCQICVDELFENLHWLVCDELPQMNQNGWFLYALRCSTNQFFIARRDCPMYLYSHPGVPQDIS